MPAELVGELGDLLSETDEDTPTEVDAVLAAHGPVRWTTLDTVLSKVSGR